MYPQINHAIEKFDFKTLLLGAQVEFYNPKIVDVLYNANIEKAIQSIMLRGEAVAKETKRRDELLISQLLEIALNRQVDLIIVPRGSAHSYITQKVENIDVFDDIKEYNQPWIPSPMDTWIRDWILNKPFMEPREVLTLKELAFILELKNHQNLSSKHIVAIEHALGVSNSIPYSKTDDARQLCRKINIDQFKNKLALAL